MAATDSGLGLVWDTSSTTAPFLHFLMTDFYPARLNDARNNTAGIVSLIPSSSERVSGKFIVEPVKFGRNPNAFGFVQEGGKFPDPGATKSRVYAYRTRTQFHRFLIQGKLLRAARGDATRYVDPLVDLMADHIDDYTVDMARILYSDGSGRVCEINTSTDILTTATSIDLRINQDIGTAYNSGSAVGGASDQPPTAYLEVGGRYLIVTSAGTIRGQVLIDSIVDDDTASMHSLTGASITTSVAGDWLVKCGHDDNVTDTKSNARRQEPMGLGGIFAYEGPFDGNGPAMEAGTDIGTGLGDEASAYTWSGTDDLTTTNAYYFQGIPASTSATGWTGDMTFNQGIVSHNSGTKRTPTEQLFMRFYSRIKRTNNARVNVIVSRDEVRDTYAETLVGDKRYNDTLNLKGGWDPALVGPAGVPWVTDIRCWHNRAYLMALEDGGFMQHVEEPLTWATEQGANVWQYLQDDDIYQGRMVESFNFGVGVRNRCGGVMVDLLEA